MLESTEITKPELLAMTVIGSAYMLNGMVFRVCAGSAAAVKVAAVKALNRMRIKVVSITKDAGQDVILAVSNEHMVEVRVKTLNPQSVRMCISAHQDDDQNDVQTAAEIIACTERLLAHPESSYAITR
ncbi:protein of unknown function [Georgfuchsia toluolica]|uniref:Uncharacterized protein n=1 Tax=Georgfuchsia toluolica TaxID=424218 RepID=A0A916NIB6_9PROT|nr:hypothetical protein [Georgfuchsia toluolica]CAG4884336.1 protein of unknown function [Georgfuchsia toluolica]